MLPVYSGGSLAKLAKTAAAAPIALFFSQVSWVFAFFAAASSSAFPGALLASRYAPPVVYASWKVPFLAPCGL